MYKTFLLAPCEENRLTLFENWMLRSINGPKEGRNIWWLA
jgi:hypothetical protein